MSDVLTPHTDLAPAMLRLDHVRAAIAATPWAILPEKLEAILEVVEHHARGGSYTAEEIAARVGAPARPGAVTKPVSGGVYVLPVMGTIAQRMSGMERASGGTSTEAIAAEFTAALRNPEVGAIVLNVDSPGGSTSGVPELAARIRAARGVKPIKAVANSLMASAAYWIASAADEVIATPSALLGSIGVFSVHRDASQAAKQMGLKHTVIRAGRYKAEGSPWEPLSDEAREAIQAQVDQLYAMFVDDVAAQRGTTAKAVRGGYGEGRVLLAQAAVAADLADRVATLDEVIAELTGARAAGSGSHRADTTPPPTSAAAEAAPTVVSPSLTPAPEARSHPVNEKDTAAPGAAPNAAAAGTAAGTTVVVGDTRQAPRADYIALAEAYGQSIADVKRWQAANMTEAHVRADIMDRDRGRVAPVGASAPTDLALSEKERKQYSVGRLVVALATNDWAQAGLEREVSNTLAKRLGRAAVGAYVPTDVPLFKSAVMTSTTAGKGAELVYPEYQGFVDLLRPRSALAQLGAQMRSGLQGTYSFVRQTTGSSLEWVGENPAADPAESDIGTEIVESNPKTAAGLLRYTRQQLVQSIEAFDSLVRNDLIATHATGMDRVGINGSGLAGQPLGLAGYNGVTVRALGVNGAVPTYGNLVDQESDIEVNNAQDLGTRAYLTTVQLAALFKQTPRMENTAGMPIMEKGEIAGFKALSSNNVPSTLTKGTSAGNCHLIAHGIWSELLLLEWGALDITVDAITQATRGVIRVISHHMMNVEVRQPKAFSLIKDAKTA